jgi:hypothetical protein
MMTLLQVKQFALLPTTAFLCVQETAPWRIMECAFIKNMNSRPRKGKEPENNGKGEEGD